MLEKKLTNFTEKNIRLLEEGIFKKCKEKSLINKILKEKTLIDNFIALNNHNFNIETLLGSYDLGVFDFIKIIDDNFFIETIIGKLSEDLIRSQDYQLFDLLHKITLDNKSNVIIIEDYITLASINYALSLIERNDTVVRSIILNKTIYRSFKMMGDEIFQPNDQLDCNKTGIRGFLFGTNVYVNYNLDQYSSYVIAEPESLGFYEISEPMLYKNFITRKGIVGWNIAQLSKIGIKNNNLIVKITNESMDNQ